MKINCAWRIHFTWEWPDYNLSSTGCPFTWQRGQVGSHQARGGLCTRMTRAGAAFCPTPSLTMGWENRAGFVGGDFQLLLRWTKISEMLASKVRWWDSPVGSPDDLLRKSTPLKWPRIVGNKARVCHADRAFCWHVVQEGGAEGDCALQIPCSESHFPFLDIVLKAGSSSSGRSASCVLWECMDSRRGPNRQLLPQLQEGRKPHTWQLFLLKGHNKL